MFLIGQSIGRYQIIEQLGQGGMAVVFKAYDTRLDRDVAVKVIRTDAFAPAVLDRLLQRFEREAKALAKLSHAGIVRVYDYGEHGSAPYLVMEYLPGGTLKQRLGQPIPYAEAAQLLIPVAHALAYAHQQGIVHRDVKPSNIIIDQSGAPVITDFGIARLLEEGEGQTLTGTGVGVGTPEYMAPEQGLGKAVDGRADMYALGVVFYELVTGRKPYTADTPLAVLLKQVNDPLPRPRDFVAGLPETVERLLFRAMAKQPEDRFENMTDFTLALEGLAQHASTVTEPLRSMEGVRSKPIGSLAVEPVDIQYTLDELTAETPMGQSQTEIRQTDRKKRIWWSLAALALLVVLIVIFVIETGALNKQIRDDADHSASAEETQHVVNLAQTITVPGMQITETQEAAVDITPATPSAEPPPAEMLAATATSEYEVGSSLVDPKDGALLMYVPAGNFLVPNGEDFEQRYTEAFWIDKYEVTNQMYFHCMDDGKCGPPSPVGNRGNFTPYRNVHWENKNRPVNFVSSEDAQNYCGWVGRRLPEKDEWIKAALGTEGMRYPWGDEFIRWAANIMPGLGRPDSVGSYAQDISPFRVYDMAGNVSEWVGNPNTGLGYIGGNYHVDAEYLQQAMIEVEEGAGWSWGIGFRCAKSEE